MAGTLDVLLREKLTRARQVGDRLVGVGSPTWNQRIVRRVNGRHRAKQFAGSSKVRSQIVDRALVGGVSPAAAFERVIVVAALVEDTAAGDLFSLGIAATMGNLSLAR